MCVCVCVCVCVRERERERERENTSPTPIAKALKDIYSHMVLGLIIYRQLFELEPFLTVCFPDSFPDFM